MIYRDPADIANEIIATERFLDRLKVEFRNTAPNTVVRTGDYGVVNVGNFTGVVSFRDYE